jgi:hypothetical protein
MFSARRALALLLALAAVACLPSAARADGDPASDYLISQQVFFGFGPNASPAKQKELALLVRAAKAKGFEVRVALIGGPTDLGSVQVLWRKPQTYARFLGQELTRWYPRRLLVVMPNGYGIYHDRPADLRVEKAALTALPAPGADLVGAAESAVQRLALLHDVRVQPTPQSAGGGNQTRERLEIVAIVLAALVAMALVKAIRMLRRSTNREPAQPPG